MTINTIAQYTLSVLILAGAAAEYFYLRRHGATPLRAFVWKWGVWPLALGNAILIWFLPVPGFGAAVAHLVLGGYLLGLFLFALGLYAGRHGEKGTDQHRRGAQICDSRQLAKLTQKEGGGITIGGVAVPQRLEARGVAFGGAPGSGKSVGFAEILDAIQARGDRMVVADSGGLHLQRYYREGDQLINPYDPRCAPWSPLSEVRNPADADSLAKSYIPDGEGSQKQWSGYAQTILGEIIKKAWAKNSNNANLYHYCCCASREELAQLLAGTPAAPLVDPGNSTMGANAISMVASAMAPLRYLPSSAGRDAFSVRKWVKAGKGNLWLTYLPEQIDSLQGLIGTLLDLASKTIISLPPDDNRRIWLVADELPNLGKIGSLPDFAANARKNGGCSLLGFQALSQLQERYGVKGAQTLLSCVGIWSILRQSDPEIAQYMARLIGDAEVQRTNRSRGKNSGGNSESEVEQITTTHLVMPSELMNLPDRSGYLILPGDYPMARIDLAIPPHRPRATDAFIQDESDPTPEDLVAGRDAPVATAAADPAPATPSEPEPAPQTPPMDPQPEPEKPAAPAFTPDF